MQTDHDIRHWVAEGSFCYHASRTADFTLWQVLLRWLKHQHNGSAQLFFHTHQKLGGSHKDCNMAVMATGMHDGNFDAIPQRPPVRSEGNCNLFGDRKRI